MRLIDADALKTRFEPKQAYFTESIVRKIDTEIEIQETRWIPCSERLPKQGQEVICQCIASIIKVLKLNADGDWYQDAEHCYMSGFVIAWMPLPEPYKEVDK